jgi:hypothetical protein
MGFGEQIIGTAIDNGASIAGIASTQALKSSSSHLIYTKMGNYEGIGTVRDDDTLSKKQLFKWPARDGAYNREICNIRMEKDVSESGKRIAGEQSPIKYCRKCEFVCPIGKKREMKKTI